jgi:hypothetical protein
MLTGQPKKKKTEKKGLPDLIRVNFKLFGYLLADA